MIYPIYEVTETKKIKHFKKKKPEFNTFVESNLNLITMSITIEKS